jgi:acyl-coenzyme A thioesterase PaaI-like protein
MSAKARRSAASGLITPPPAANLPAGPFRRGLGPHHPAFDGCFGCAPAHPSGLRVRMTGDGTFEFTLQPGQQGTPGRVHGGVLAAVLDETMGMMAWSLGGSYATARLEVDYLAPVPLSGTVHIQARCTGRYRRKVYIAAEGRLGDATGPVAVRAAALYIETPGGAGAAGPGPRAHGGPTEAGERLG